MKKIAFVFDGIGLGGIERVGIDYMKICKTLGYEVDVYNLVPKQNKMIEMIPEGIKVFNKFLPRKLCPELYSYAVQKVWWGKYAYCAVSPFISLIELFLNLFTKKRKYDVAIAMSGHVNDLNFVCKNFIKANKKIAWCHGNIICYFAMWDAYPILYKKIDKFVVLSNAGQKDIYPGHRFMFNKQITKIYNPTFMSKENVNQQNVASLKEKYGDFILMSARIVDYKGQDVAIKAVRKLKDIGINKKIVFIGEGNFSDYCKKLAQDLDVAENCIFEGYRNNVPDYIAACHVNLLTSKWEGLPTVIVEAMVFGKPCVMTNSDDGEVSGNGKYCFLTEVDDVDAITDALKLLYTDSECYKKYENLSLQRAKDFSVATASEKFKKLIEE